MLRLFSPAKINLFLHILDKRPDGYHNLASLLQAISLGDRLSIQSAPQDSVTSSDPNLATDETNLVFQALQLFKCKSGLKASFTIHLEKNIPIQAGLGGGSGDAATVLWGLNALTGRKFETSLLQEWSAEIGSDIPFFFSCGTAYCTGRGERVLDLPDAFKPITALIIKPKVGLSTPLIFKHFALSKRSTPLFNEKELLKAFLNREMAPFNDLEEPAFAVIPSLKELKSRLLEEGFSTVLMTGSGSSFFCLGEGKISNFISTHPELSCYQTTFINRSADEWYKDPLTLLTSKKE